jgi:hypothetical protein
MYIFKSSDTNFKILNEGSELYPLVGEDSYWHKTLNPQFKINLSNVDKAKNQIDPIWSIYDESPGVQNVEDQRAKAHEIFNGHIRDSYKDMVFISERVPSRAPAFKSTKISTGKLTIELTDFLMTYNSDAKSLPKNDFVIFYRIYTNLYNSRFPALQNGVGAHISYFHDKIIEEYLSRVKSK